MRLRPHEGRGNLESRGCVSESHADPCRVGSGGENRNHIIRDVLRILIVLHREKQLELVPETGQLFLGTGFAALK